MTDTPKPERHETTRECYCHTCYDYSQNRRRNIRCGRRPRDIYWTIPGSAVRYSRRRDAVAAMQAGETA